MNVVTIAGGGPAGSAAALSALQAGADVRLFEKSAFPRHKVCGEFLSPEIEGPLRELGVWETFITASPAVVRSLELFIGNSVRRSALPKPAFGLSRYKFDNLLLEAAIQRGADLLRESGNTTARPLVRAYGRFAVAPSAQKGRRLFGFKAHFAGEPRDVVELYFFRECYVGINSVEGGLTNVCGLGPEHRLREVGFEIDELLQQSAVLRQRLAPLQRVMDWMSVGPLVFQNAFREPLLEGLYPAGDALQFVDPFTGSGMLSAVLAGKVAGAAAAQGIPSADYMRQVKSQLHPAFRWSAALRWAASHRWAGIAAEAVPTSWLYSLTRPSSIAFRDRQPARRVQLP